MSTYNHILVALALDQTGRTVLKRTCALAKLFGARLSVLHVVEYIPIESGELLMTAPVDLTQQLEQQSRQQLEALRSEEHTSELQSLMRISYAVFCLQKKNHVNTTHLCSIQILPRNH